MNSPRRLARFREQAVLEIMGLTIEAYDGLDQKLAEKVEPLEQVIDLLADTIRLNHIDRLQSGDCTIERGFVLADILTNYERSVVLPGFL